MELQRVYPSSFQSVAQARRAVASFAERCGFDRSEVYDITLAVAEACSNAVEHGHTPDASFAVNCDYADGIMRIAITGESPGFAGDGTSAIQDVDSLSRGRGVPIMRMLMDRVTYVAGKRGTVATLVKKRRGVAKEAKSDSDSVTAS